MPDNGNDKPSIEELEAKRTRLQAEVTDAESAYDVAKQTFADACERDSGAVDTLLELSQAVTAAKGTVETAKRNVGKCQRDIDGFHFEAKMAGVTEASLSLVEAVREAVTDWRDANAEVLADANVTGLGMTADLASEPIAVGVKPTGEDMPKRPSGTASGGPRGPRGTRNVTFTADGVAPSRVGESVSCREYVAACGEMASPAAQADLAGQWDGSPVSYTNEAKRLAAKNNDTFA